MIQIEKKSFWLDDTPSFEGYTFKGNTWNGWQCPLFTKDVGKEILKALADNNTSTYYDENIDAFIVIFNSLTEDRETEVYASKIIEYEGEEITVYPIGYGSWCWSVSQ